MAEHVCLDCPKEYWIAFVLESYGEEVRAGESAHSFRPANGLDMFTCFSVTGSQEKASSLTLVRNVVWLDAQGSPANNVSIDYFLCQDMEAHVNLRAESPHQKVLP